MRYLIIGPPELLNIIYLQFNGKTASVPNYTNSNNYIVALTIENNKCSLLWYDTLDTWSKIYTIINLGNHDEIR